MENSGPPAAVYGFRDRRPEALGDFRILPDEVINTILENLTPRDVSRLACVSSVMYILCNEEPLWMSLCLNSAKGPLQYKGSWKETTLHLENVPRGYEEPCRKQLQFDGFNSIFLYRRFYRCHTTLDGFYLDAGNVERKDDLSLEEFQNEFDGKKPIILSGLVNTWPARRTWSIDHLSQKYGDIAFKISQRSAKKISMKFKDYAAYMQLQHDEDPLYIFDDKFGEAAPDLLKDYDVPHLFQEDLFDVLDDDKRPPFRWLIIGPERSGASWHVDPALTSAWNTLLCGRKRWALYPPGKVPLGVTVHVSEEDGDVNIETPSSLQWWLDFYPLLADEDKPIECTQLPGETIYVPSGWWHCVLNLESTIAVTQNFVNFNNFEFVCFDMAPGYRHKGVCRAGFLALDGNGLEDSETHIPCDKGSLSTFDLERKEKRIKVHKCEYDRTHKKSISCASKFYNLWRQGFSYDINFLASFLDKERDHYNSPWSPGSCIGQRELREWLSKLWYEKPAIRELIWKGACLAINAGKWLECLEEICAFHDLSPPSDDERLPVGTGSNPVYLMDDHVVKIYIEEGVEASLYSLGTELEFYNILCKGNSPLKNHIPGVLASGILYLENGAYKIVPWDGKKIPDVIAKCNLLPEMYQANEFPFGAWSKKQFEFRKAGLSMYEPMDSAELKNIWPYIITKRCRGKMFAQLRDSLSWDDALNLASFLGEQLRNLHLLPHPPFNSTISSTSYTSESIPDGSKIHPKWDVLIKILDKKRKGISDHVKKWGSSIPRSLVEKVDEYLPDDMAKLFDTIEDENDLKDCMGLSWIHSDIMDDNIQMKPCLVKLCLDGSTGDNNLLSNGSKNGWKDLEESESWCPSYILDFSNLSIDDPICDLIPIYLDIFRGNPNLLQQFLESYKLPLARRSQNFDSGDKSRRHSYRIMCYCILHEEDILGAMSSIWKELKTAKSWEEIELTVWGGLNNYKGLT
ncbi:unnamed protein product [Citrullus colocynthis]|uniref:F-box protein n=1 Tax=Citrullus colocynthis TaxID=252529 RepID=A0ABP0Y0G0_9ROSI